MKVLIFKDDNKQENNEDNVLSKDKKHIIRD